MRKREQWRERRQSSNKEFRLAQQANRRDSKEKEEQGEGEEVEVNSKVTDVIICEEYIQR